MNGMTVPLKDLGYDHRVVSIERLAGLKERVESHRRQGLFDSIFYQKQLSDFVFHLPENMPSARSLIIVAVPQPKSEVTFIWKGKRLTAVIPPTYVYSGIEKKVKQSLVDCLSPQGFQVVRAKIPVKSLAVCSGLGRYGKNNICYVEEIGSFHRLAAFYSELSSSSEQWEEPQMMEACRDCDACLRACPTKAIISERFLIRAERCLSYFNEGSDPFPEWIKPAWHNCLVGCMYCQRACPVDQGFLDQIDKSMEFFEEETAQILEETSVDRLSKETLRKLKGLDLIDYLGALPRNLKALFAKAGI